MLQIKLAIIFIIISLVDLIINKHSLSVVALTPINRQHGSKRLYNLLEYSRQQKTPYFLNSGISPLRHEQIDHDRPLSHERLLLHMQSSPHTELINDMKLAHENQQPNNAAQASSDNKKVDLTNKMLFKHRKTLNNDLKFTNELSDQSISALDHAPMLSNTIINDQKASISSPSANDHSLIRSLIDNDNDNGKNIESKLLLSATTESSSPLGSSYPSETASPLDATTSVILLDTAQDQNIENQLNIINLGISTGGTYSLLPRLQSAIPAWILPQAQAENNFTSTELSPSSLSFSPISTLKPQNQPIVYPGYQQQPYLTPSGQQLIVTPNYQQQQQQQPGLNPNYQQQPYATPNNQQPMATFGNQQPYIIPSTQQQPIVNPSNNQPSYTTPNYQQQSIPTSINPQPSFTIGSQQPIFLPNNLQPIMTPVTQQSILTPNNQQQPYFTTGNQQQIFVPPNNQPIMDSTIQQPSVNPINQQAIATPSIPLQPIITSSNQQSLMVPINQQSTIASSNQQQPITTTSTQQQSLITPSSQQPTPALNNQQSLMNAINQQPLVITSNQQQPIGILNNQLSPATSINQQPLATITTNNNQQQSTSIFNNQQPILSLPNDSDQEDQQLDIYPSNQLSSGLILPLDNTLEDLQKLPGVTIGQIINMGFDHPRAWDSMHCIQVPIFTTGKEIPNCISKRGWYYDVSTESCQRVNKTCGSISTLNFWRSPQKCIVNCTEDGRGIVMMNTTQNLDPRKICILPLITGQTPCRDLEKQIIWTYDATISACYQVQLDCTYELSQNNYPSGNMCQHFCHDISLPGSTQGHHLI